MVLRTTEIVSASKAVVIVMESRIAHLRTYHAEAGEASATQTDDNHISTSFMIGQRHDIAISIGLDRVPDPDGRDETS